MAGTNPRDPAFSQILYCVPVDTDVEATGAVAPGVLSGQTAMATGLTPAQGVSALSRHFIPVNGPDEVDAGAIDYGTAVQNRAAQREECEQMIGDRLVANVSTEIGWTVFGNQ